MAFRAALLLAALLLAALPAAAAPMASPVAAGDEAIGQDVATRRMTLAFVDADLDSVFDASGPAEPMYLDADASGTVTYGDLRLMPFGTYAGGTDVAPADTDVGRALSPLRGWFAVSGTAWFVDIDSSNTVSVGDVRLDADGPAGQRVAAGDEVGAPLSSSASAGQAAFRDLDGDGRRDAGEAIVVDLDASGTVTAGDLRLHVSDPPSAPADGAPGSDAGDGHAIGGDDGSDAGDVGTADGRSLRGFDVLLLALVVANLLGLVYVVRAVGSSRPPRNPFK